MSAFAIVEWFSLGYAIFGKRTSHDENTKKINFTKEINSIAD